MTRVPGKSYVVGGAVRDRLLGLPQSDRDHVVVGATAEEMIAAGFRPVGRDFPVFLHPQTHEEYALARTERKVAPGYAGFVFHADPSVTLEADLERRDLTINAMAEDDETGRLVDPFGGRGDLDARVFRHVGPAFVEDPVRVLRVARFAARFAEFHVDEGTLGLMRTMARAGEIDALVAERVWHEIARGLAERHPVRMFDLLRAADALARIAPELAALSPERWRAAAQALDRAATAGAPTGVRFAALTHALGSEFGSESGINRGATSTIEALCERLSVPRAIREVAVLTAREGPDLVALTAPSRSSPSADAWVDLLTRCDAWRRRERFAEVVEATAATLAGEERRNLLRTTIDRVVTAALSVDASRIARDAAGQGTVIVSRLRDARSAAIASLLPE